MQNRSYSTGYSTEIVVQKPAPTVADAGSIGDRSHLPLSRSHSPGASAITQAGRDRKFGVQTRIAVKV